jgi:hypothetical protein
MNVTLFQSSVVYIAAVFLLMLLSAHIISGWKQAEQLQQGMYMIVLKFVTSNSRDRTQSLSVQTREEEEHTLQSSFHVQMECSSITVAGRVERVDIVLTIVDVVSSHETQIHSTTTLRT